MNLPILHGRKLGSHKDSGVALVLTLLVVAMLTVVLVSFNAVTRTEQAAARNYTKHGVGYKVASTAEQQAIELLRNTLTNTNLTLITQPGKATYWDSNGALQEVQLSSAGVAGATTDFVNLNFNVTHGTTNWGAVSSNTSPNYFEAPWVNIVDSAGRLTARYAFWIDDNGSRMNLNLARTNPRQSFYPTNARPLDALRLVFGTNAATASNNLSAFTNSLRGFPAALTHNAAPTLTTNRNPHTPTWGYFFIPEQIRSFGATNTNQAVNRTAAQRLFNALQWQVAAGPGNLTNINEPPNRFGRQILSANFLNAFGSPAQAVPTFITSQLNSGFMQSRFGGQSFAAKYTTNALGQILANINDLAAGSVGIAYGADLLDQQENVPERFAGLRPYPHLNEVAVRPYYAVAPNGSQIEVQVYLGVELINPYPAALGEGARLYFDLERFDFSGTYERDGVTNNIVGGTNPWPRTGVFLATPITVSSNVPSRSYSTNGYFYRWEWSVNTPAPAGAPAISNVNISVNFQLRTIQLSQTTNPATMRDWAVSSDLPLWNFDVGSLAGGSNSVFYGFGNTGPLTALPAGVTVSDAVARGVAKNDPRVRTFPAWGNVPDVAAWLSVGTGGPAITLGANNSVVDFQAGTGTPRNLPNDDAPPGNDVFSHPSFGAMDRSQPTSWLSAFELGQVHTGLQWRTLHLHSQKSNEIGVIPDWAFLDVFAVTNAYVPVSTRINVNSLPHPALSEGLQPTTAVAQGLSRAGTYASLLSGFVAANSPASAQVLLNGALTNAGLISSPAASFASNQIGPIATNIATVAFTASNTWRTTRLTLPGFPAGTFGTLAELAEVAGVSDGNMLKSEKEQRFRVLYESMAPYSDTFTIYSIGQAVEVVPGAPLNILGEARTRTQVQFDPATGKIKTIVRMPVVTP